MTDLTATTLATTPAASSPIVLSIQLAAIDPTATTTSVSDASNIFTRVFSGALDIIDDVTKPHVASLA